MPTTLMNMSYLNVKSIELALVRVNNESPEHRTSTVTNGLLNYYFARDKFAITPEQKQGSNRRPDLSLERVENNSLVYHAGIELKSHKGDSFSKAANQLQEAITETIDSTNKYTVYAIIVKGKSIGFFVYYSYASLLDENGITNYEGFMPINFVIPFSALVALNNNAYNDLDYANYMSNFPLVPSDSITLTELGVRSNDDFKFPFIWDLTNLKHVPYIQAMFQNMASHTPIDIIKD